MPKGEWYDYYRGFHRISNNGEFVNVQVRRNETSLFVRGGSVIFKQDCLPTVTERLLLNLQFISFWHEKFKEYFSIVKTHSLT